MGDVTCEQRRAEVVGASFRSEPLAFARIPDLPTLFLDFLSDFEKVADFYRGGRLLLPLTREDAAALRERARRVAARLPEREALCRVLREQNARWGASEATLTAIRELAEPETVAIVTGQQAGLFTGPLLTLYKAWTAIGAARLLRAWGIRAVPIFWIHSEDHDLKEATECGLLGRDGEWVKVPYPIAPEEEGKPASAILLDERADAALATLLGALPDSEFLPEIEALLRAAYAKGLSLTDAFARAMVRLTAEEGLVLLDPADERLKRLTAGVLERIVREWPRVIAAFGAHSERVKARGYRLQIHPERAGAFLFLLDDGRRRPLIGEGERFALRDGGRAFTREELLREIVEHPARFSPNVALRPVVQDALLPTLAYVGGPSEIAYFAQLRPVYEACEVPEPLLCPRVSLTLVEPRAAELLMRYGLALTDLFAGIAAIHQRLIERTLEANHASLFDEARAAVTEAVRKLRPLLREADPTLERPLDRAEEAMHRQIETLRQHYLRARPRRDEALARHARRLVLALAPHGMPQERAMTVFYFLARYGDRVARAIREAIALGNRAHHVLFL
ncbi:Putative cysteine ligase BshC [bacterium HR10]|nr:Putative cysteine ligase BshC [bacterium HR10]